METDILIIGGGLSGLSLATTIEAQGRDWHLLEAQPDLGGRIRSQMIGAASFDLGPAWFWHGQPRIAALVHRLGLRVFEQFSSGAQIFQERSGTVHIHQGYSPMSGSLRLDGGMASLIRGLVQPLPGPRIRTGEAVTVLQKAGGRINAIHTSGTISARQVVLALPPRVAAERIQFEPALPRSAMEAVVALPTWMAGQAKILAVYDSPHWRKAGLSGDAMSQRGPMVEMHDASPADGGPYAIFGFVGVSAEVRALNPQHVVTAAQDQLVALFGAAMAEPLSIRMMDWALVPEIATSMDKASPSYHPSYGLPRDLRGVWDNTLFFGSTEMASQFGGFLEGALEAVEIVSSQLDMTCANDAPSRDMVAIAPEPRPLQRQ